MIEKKYTEAINLALDHIMERNNKSLIWGPGATDPKRVFGTTDNLIEKYGSNRVVDGSISEAAYTGMALGMSLAGHLPIIHFQRIDFMYMAWDQLVNNICKWSSMFGEEIKTPIIIRAIIGRGWGQGQQHSQNPLNMLVNLPGIDVYTPLTSQNVYDTFIHCSKQNRPSLIVEHRWLGSFQQEINTQREKAKCEYELQLHSGHDITLASYSYGSVETLRAARHLAKHGIHCDVISLNKLNEESFQLLNKSINKTKKLLVFDLSWKGFSPIYWSISQQCLKSNINFDFIHLPSSYTPAAQRLVKTYYPTFIDIIEKIEEILKLQKTQHSPNLQRAVDQPYYENEFWS